MRTTAVVLLIACFAAHASAQGNGGSACRADAQRYCAQTSGSENIRECLIGHQQDISDGCYDFLKTQLSRQGNSGDRQGSGGGANACKADVTQYCKGIEQGGGRIVNCLIDHQNDISDGCYNFLKSQTGQRQQSGAANACKGDVAQYCKGVEPGGGRIIGCLIDHQQEITDGCYDFLKKQKSGKSASAGERMDTSAPPRPIYRSQQANGRVLYSDVPDAGAGAERLPVVRQ